MTELWDARNFQSSISRGGISTTREISKWISRSGNRPLSLGLTFTYGLMQLHQVELDFPWTWLAHIDLIDRPVNHTLARQILTHAPNLIS